MVWFEYYAALFGDAQFMRRNSLAIYYGHTGSRSPSYRWGFVFVSGVHFSAFEILTASLVKFWILAKITLQALPHKAYPLPHCGRTRSSMPHQIFTENEPYHFTINRLRLYLRRIGVIKPPPNDHRMTFCEILNFP